MSWNPFSLATQLLEAAVRLGLKSVVRSLLALVAIFCLLTVTPLLAEEIRPIVRAILLVIFACEGFNLIYRSFTGTK
jgi:hypothetical protein